MAGEEHVYVASSTYSLAWDIRYFVPVNRSLNKSISASNIMKQGQISSWGGYFRILKNMNGINMLTANFAPINKPGNSNLNLIPGTMLNPHAPKLQFLQGYISSSVPSPELIGPQLDIPHPPPLRGNTHALANPHALGGKVI